MAEVHHHQQAVGAAALDAIGDMQDALADAGERDGVARGSRGARGERSGGQGEQALEMLAPGESSHVASKWRIIAFEGRTRCVPSPGLRRNCRIDCRKIWSLGDAY